jgi:hypothetical protein
MQLPPSESISSIPSHLRLHWHRPVQPLSLTPTNETSALWTVHTQPYHQYRNYIHDWRREIGSLSFRNWLSSGFATRFASIYVLTLVFVQFRVAKHVITIVSILLHLYGFCESKLTTAGNSGEWYGVSYSKVRHPRQWRDSAITGGQRGKVGMIRRMTKVENRLWELSTATAGEAKAGSGDGTLGRQSSSSSSS